jgi:transglutaminase-like putative cysteine protease
MLLICLLLMGGNAFSAWFNNQQPYTAATEDAAAGVTENNLPAPPENENKAESTENTSGEIAVASSQEEKPVLVEEDKPEIAGRQAETAARPLVQPTAASTPPVKTTVRKDTPPAPFTLGAARDYNLVSAITVKNTGDTHSNNIRLNVPLVSSSSLYQHQGGDNFSLEPQEIQILHGIRVGLFHLGSLAPGAETTLELRYHLKTSVIRFHSDFVPDTTPAAPAVWLTPSRGTESDHSSITTLASQITANLAGDWDKAEAITSWVARNITYDASAPNRNGGALQALTNRKGVCEDFAALAAALARASGIPARVAYGYADGGTRWPAQGAFSLRGSRHAWVEFYLAGWGWVPAEPTRSRSGTLYFGTLPHNRYIVQNYNDTNLRVGYSGGKLAVSWNYATE